MSQMETVRRGPYGRASFRYGMLVFILVLWSYAWWHWFTSTPQNRTSPALNVVVTSMLLVNHVVESFLSVEQRRRIRVVQFTFIGVCVVYVFRSAFRIG